MDQREDSFHGVLLIALGRTPILARHLGHLVEADQRRRMGATAYDLGRGGVVRDPVDPGAQGTPAVEAGQAPPQRDVNLLQQVAPAVGVSFVGPG